MFPMDNDEMHAKFKQTKLVYVCIIISVFIYAVIVELTKRNPEFLSHGQPKAEVDMLRYVLYGISMATFFIIKMLRNYLLSNRGQYSFKKPMSAAAKLASIDIMTAALCETAAIYGLVLFFIERRSDDFYILMAISLIYFAIYFPRLSSWLEYVKKYEATSQV